MSHTILVPALLALFGLTTPTLQAGPTADLAAQATLPISSAGQVLGQPFTLKVGQTARLTDARLSVRFNGVAEDSRCPKGVQCVWAGRFVASMTLTRTDDGSTQDLELTLGQPQDVLGYSVTLNAASPSPSKDQPTPSESDYVLTLTIGQSQSSS